MHDQSVNFVVIAIVRSQTHSPLDSFTLICSVYGHVWLHLWYKWAIICRMKQQNERSCTSGTAIIPRIPISVGAFACTAPIPVLRPFPLPQCSTKSQSGPSRVSSTSVDVGLIEDMVVEEYSH